MQSLPKLWKYFRTQVIKRKFVRDVGVLTIANLVAAMLSFAQGIFVARWLGPERYGMAALVMTYPGLVFAFFDARSAEASVKYLSEFYARGDRDRVLGMCKLGYIIDVGIAMLAFFTVFSTASWAAQAIAHRPEAVGLIVVYAAAFIPRGLVGTSRAVMVTLGKFNLIAWIETCTTFLRVVLVLSLAFAGWQVAGVVWGNTIAMAVTGLVQGAIGWFMIYRHWGALPFQGKCQHLKQQSQEIFKFLFYNNITALIGTIPKQIDILLLGYFRSPLEVGYYQLAKKLSSIVSYFVGPLQSVTYPEISRLSGLGKISAIQNKVKKLAFQVGLPLGLTVLVVTLLLPSGLTIFFGDEYQPAATAIQLLFLGSAIWLTFFWLKPVFMTIGEMKFWASNSVLVVMLTLTGFAFAIPVGGYVGLAWVWLITGGLGGHLFATIYLLYKWKIASAVAGEL
ncbi:MAG: lipopolysaccharide biosynthesis protein [Hormoscilla sp.]